MNRLLAVLTLVPCFGDVLELRAERLGSGSGRTYTIAVTCTDANGSAGTRSATVTVPHDQGN
jgi:hypothetical protein